MSNKGLNHYFNELKKNWRQKIWWREVIKGVIIYKILPLFFRDNNGHYVLKERWDNLIILDACRFDVFKEEIKNWDIKGELEYRISRGSWTVSFLLENFNEKFGPKLDEIIYVTANPYVSMLLKGKFYRIIPVWDFGWDESLKTVPPDHVYEATLEVVRKYQKKRIIIHFMQPHEPFINLGETKATGFSMLRNVVLSGKDSEVHDTSIWSLVEKGVMSRENAIKGYVENLKAVMPYVEKLCKILPGKTIITSDHGEAFGERVHPLIPIRIYGHHPNIRIESLVKVPWFICEEEGRLDKVERARLRELIKKKIRKLTM